MADEPTKDASEGPSLLIIGGLAFLLVLVVGAGAMFALGVGPFAQPAPVPTLVAQPTPTARPGTPAPTTTAGATSTSAASPTASAGPTATPIPSGDVEGLLLSHVPDAIAGSCLVTKGQGNIVARATCSADDGNIALTYFQYDSYDSMFTAYEGFRLASQIEPGQGDCSDPATWPTENAFNIGGQVAGRWLCTEALGHTSIYWIDNRLNILSQATQTETNIPRLVDFWAHDSGPNL
jgi:hypothetical protein